MSGIFKVTHNALHNFYRTTGPDGEKGERIIDESDADEFEPVEDGAADYSATVSADDAEDAIAKVRAAIVGTCEAIEDDGEWTICEVKAIQIVRVEPVAFTTIPL